MRLAEINQAIKETCPFGRTACALAYMGKCSPVNLWRFDHHGKTFYGALPAAVDEAWKEKQRAYSRRGAAVQRRFRSLNFAKH